MNGHHDLRVPLFLAPEYGGDNTKGGGHPADETAPAAEAIADGLEQDGAGRGMVPGTNDPGVPGSRTNPVQGEPQRGSDEPLGRPTAEGSGSGS